jgi:hypothetical protein
MARLVPGEVLPRVLADSDVKKEVQTLVQCLCGKEMFTNKSGKWFCKSCKYTYTPKKV